MKNSDKVSDSVSPRATRQRHPKETRAQMMERLTNPLLSLHEAGVILNVCAATLRRYSDSGVLPHERTTGGQRRFRLRDVLELLDEREEQRLAARRRRRTRGRIRGSQLRPEARKAGSLPSKAPVLSERERREIEGRKALEEAKASFQRLSQAAAQKNAARDTPPTRGNAPARNNLPSRISLSKFAALGRREMLEDAARHEAVKRNDTAQRDEA